MQRAVRSIFKSQKTERLLVKSTAESWFGPICLHNILKKFKKSTWGTIISGFLGKKMKHLPSFKILHPICTSCFPELSGARCHLKKEPTRSSDDVRGDSCCLVLPQSKGCHMAEAHRVPSLVAWDDRTAVPLCCARDKVGLIVTVDDLL